MMYMFCSCDTLVAIHIVKRQSFDIERISCVVGNVVGASFQAGDANSQVFGLTSGGHGSIIFSVVLCFCTTITPNYDALLVLFFTHLLKSI